MSLIWRLLRHSSLRDSFPRNDVGVKPRNDELIMVNYSFIRLPARYDFVSGGQEG